jgi:hypothetical protein
MVKIPMGQDHASVRVNVHSLDFSQFSERGSVKKDRGTDVEKSENRRTFGGMGMKRVAARLAHINNTNMRMI